MPMIWSPIDIESAHKRCVWSLCVECANSLGPSILFDPAVDYERKQQYVQATAELLFGTAAIESDLRYMRQTTVDPMSERGGFGLWQIELETANSLLTNLRHRPTLSAAVASFIWPDDTYPNRWYEVGSTVGNRRISWLLRGSHRAGAAIARLKYLSIPSAIPWDDMPEKRTERLGEYWKEHYNTHLGSGTVGRYISTFERLCRPVIEGG